MSQIKKFWGNFKKFWDFVWNDDSALSWVLNIVVAVILIKFIIYPVLGLLLGTGYPIVAVVSGSMEHAYVPKVNPVSGDFVSSDTQIQYYLCNDKIMRDEKFVNLRDFVSFDTFWEACKNFYIEKEITKEEFEKFPFKNGFNTGDIMILYGSKAEDINIGDIIVFSSPAKSDPIIHRVVGKWQENGKYHFTTKGDHNEGENFQVRESDITEDRIIAKAVIRVPYLGWIKIGAFNLLQKTISMF